MDQGRQHADPEFADPTSTANYALCFYSGPTESLIGSAEVPPGTTGPRSAPRATSTRIRAAPGGIQKIILKGSPNNKSKALVKGKGDGLPDFTLPFPGSQLPVVVQLRNNQTGICWEGSFASPIKNQPGGFKAKAQ